MSDETLGSPENVVHADAETNLLDHAVRVLCIDVVLNGDSAVLFELGRGNLHQVGDFRLQMSVSLFVNLTLEVPMMLTNMNILYCCYVCS